MTAGEAASGIVWPLHDLIGVATLPQQRRHELHRFVDMCEERLVAGAKIVQTVFSVRRLDETVARALAVTGEQDRALLAIFRERVVFALAEATLLFGRYERFQRGFRDVA